MEGTSGRGRKRKGGLHQRRARRARQDDAADAPSALHALLMTWLAQGIMSGVQVHKVAQAAKKDIVMAKNGSRFSDLDQLSSLQHGKHVIRSVHSMLAKSSPLPSPFHAPMPYTDGVQDSLLLLPHELFAYMYENQDVWEEKILADPSKLPEFWGGMRNHPGLESHPLWSREDHCNRCIPVSIHGDEVPCFGIGKIWSRSVLSFSWCSVIQNALGGSCETIMIYIFGLFEKFAQSSGEAAAGTREIFFRILSWSLRAMWEGVWPSRDWRNVPYTRESAEATLDTQFYIFYFSQNRVISLCFLFEKSIKEKKWTTSRRRLFL